MAYINDYKRLVSYIYSYPGGIRDRNVGFAKVEVKDGMFKINVSLKGVYTDAPEVFGVYLCVDKNVSQKGSCNLLHIGNVMVKNGAGQYADVLNAGNINMTQYDFSDVRGVVIAREDNRFYMMFSMWDDDVPDCTKVRFLQKDYKRDKEPAQTDVENYGLDKSDGDADSEKSAESAEFIESERKPESAEYIESEKKSEIAQYIDSERKTEIAENVEFEENVEYEENVEKAHIIESEVSTIPQMEELFNNCDYVNAFADDYCYDCIEVTLEQLRNTPLGDEEIVNNSFLEHGYYNFRHLLFGRVQKNEKHTEYFVGVPGMYCNRERFMASMFGFNNFKKSHRSDYANPYFGYWYQEI